MISTKNCLDSQFFTNYKKSDPHLRNVGNNIKLLNLSGDALEPSWFYPLIRSQRIALTYSGSLKSEVCPMPYALCPMPDAHEYLIFVRKAIYPVDVISANLVWGFVISHILRLFNTLNATEINKHHK